MVGKTFFEDIKIGQEIPILKRKAELVGQHFLPPVFGGMELEADQSKAEERARELGVDPIHVAKIFGGIWLLEFLSQMMTNWLPNPKGWLEGGRLNARFIGIIHPGETIQCKGKVLDKVSENGNDYAICEVWIENEAGQKVVIGEGTINFGKA